mmetsp:Transcript_11210/g.24306  ORF Transcript_11210/g.24306 Transcript_11210/m.24306 type:complete len:169 (-) Transcript_11210:56-562(-)
MSARSALVSVLLLARTTAAILSIDFKNEAQNGVKLMNKCQEVGHYAAGEGTLLNFTQDATKLWVVPDGCTQERGCYPCNLDCLGCFYISAIVSADQSTLVTGIGYGENAPVQVHDMVSDASFSAIDAAGKEETVTCSTASCDFEHIIQGKSSMKFVVHYSADASSFLV